ncbi:hypothetical protein [Halobacterium zhouii]|uniref:hypothetical protein n=1 Tax=Halobacterium zhouii TaxID=2902624 RepID=UPI001E38F3B5|nr:hypothetical protein [Halobacterium zhouii]
MSEKIRKLDRMGRRRFIKTLSGIGVSATALNYLSQESLADTVGDISDEVPEVALLAYNNPDATFKDADETGRAPIYRTIPRHRWQINHAAMNAAKRVQQAVEKQLGGKQDDVGVEVRSDGDSVANRIVIVSTTLEGYTDSTTDLDAIHDATPRKAQGVVGSGQHEYKQQFPVDVEEVHVIPQHYYDSDYDGSIPGGCELGIQVELANYFGTSTCGAVREDNHGKAMISAGHFIDRAHPSDVNEVNQPQYGEVVGTHGWDWESGYFDAGFAYHNEGISQGTQLANDSGGRKPEQIDGIIPYNAIKGSIGDESYSLNIQGCRTGHHDVYPTGIRMGPNENDYQFKTSIGDTKEGDSGGPHYKYDNGYIYIGGVHAGISKEDNEPVATSAEYVENQFNLKIPHLGRDKL